MAPITIGDTALLEHSLRVKRADRGWQTEVAARGDRRAVTPAAAERREARPDPLRVVLARLLNGGVFAAVAAWMTRFFMPLATSPDGLRSEEHALAGLGMTWTSDPAEDERLADEMRQASRRRAQTRVQELGAAPLPPNVVAINGERVIRAPLAADRYPILTVIDRARDDDRPGFAADPHAARLEPFARKLTEQFWSKFAWVTGFVPERAFGLVCEALERERAVAARAVEVTADLGTAA